MIAGVDEEMAAAGGPQDIAGRTGKAADGLTPALVGSDVFVEMGIRGRHDIGVYTMVSE
jgi:hypothetical protein